MCNYFIRKIFVFSILCCGLLCGCINPHPERTASASISSENGAIFVENTAVTGENVDSAPNASAILTAGSQITSLSDGVADNVSANNSNQKKAEDSDLVANGTQNDCKPCYDFPVVKNAQVQERLDYYTTGPGQRSFHLWLERSGKYLPLMQQIFAEEDLPQDLIMMALIESGFSSNAHSWANAVGYWQFIESTGRMYGLENDWWRDERRDVEKATRAAAQYLRDLHTRFDGDWYLAVAAYNAGPGKILNAIRRYNTRDFWQLSQGSYLRAETKDYIPKLLAAIIISKEPERYGFTELQYADPLAFDTVILPQSTDLEVVAELTGADYSILKELNPELKRWCSPPGTGHYILRVPSGGAQGFAERYASIPPKKRVRYRRHELRSGENLALLAQRYNIRVDDIVTLNRIKDPRRLQIGQNLILPLHHNYSSLPLAELEDDYVRSYRRSYTVRKGDSLWAIARRNNVSEKQLRVWNRLGWSDLLQPGQKLLVSASSINSGRDHTPVRQIVYKVRKGDTLWDIGKQYSVDAGEIRQWNNLAENHMIRPGDKLTLKVTSG